MNKLNIGDLVRVRPTCEWYVAEGHDTEFFISAVNLDLYHGITYELGQLIEGHRIERRIDRADGYKLSDLEYLNKNWITDTNEFYHLRIEG